MNLDEFLRSNLRNSYIRENHMEVYVRKSTRLIKGEWIQFIDVANVTVEWDFRSKGIFTGFLKSLIFDYEFNIYVESILNPIVERICLNLGFSRVDRGYESELNMYKQSDGE
jgi:hypothetical protein